MQLEIPKCVEDGYVENGKIKANAPEWAKKEFERYKALLKSIEEPDENGFVGAVPEPKFIKEGWASFDEETEEYKLLPNAPSWAKKEYAEYYRILNEEPDEYGVCTRY